MLPYFEDTAKKLIKEKGEVKALSAALAVLSGYMQPFKTKSLLSSAEGYTTIRVYSARPIFSARYLTSLVQSFTNDVKEIRICDGGAVFDVPEEAASKLVEQSLQQAEINLGRSIPFRYEICTELPELEIADTRTTTERGGRGGGSRGGGYGGSGSRSGFGSGRGRGTFVRGGMNGRSSSNGRGGFGSGGRAGFGSRGRGGSTNEGRNGFGSRGMNGDHRGGNFSGMKRKLDV